MSRVPGGAWNNGTGGEASEPDHQAPRRFLGIEEDGMGQDDTGYRREEMGSRAATGGTPRRASPLRVTARLPGPVLGPVLGLVLAVVTVVVTLPATGAPAGAATRRTSAEPTVLVVGDSLLTQHATLGTALDDAGWRVVTLTGSLADRDDRLSSEIRAAIDRERPAVVLAVFAGDQPARDRLITDAAGRWVNSDTPVWQRMWRQRIWRLVEATGAAKGRFVLVVAPPVDPGVSGLASRRTLGVAATHRSLGVRRVDWAAAIGSAETWTPRVTIDGTAVAPRDRDGSLSEAAERAAVAATVATLDASRLPATRSPAAATPAPASAGTPAAGTPAAGTPAPERPVTTPLVATSGPLAGQANGLLDAEVLVTVRSGCRVFHQAARGLADLLGAARAEGIPLQHGPGGCYRTLLGQERLKAERCAPGRSATTCASAATPGRSMHGWGLAVDFTCDGGGMDFWTPCYRWLARHGERFGWVNPAWARPGGGGVLEPWHWEFVGIAPPEVRAGD
jgi:hypothetical protein